MSHGGPNKIRADLKSPSLLVAMPLFYNCGYVHNRFTSSFLSSWLYLNFFNFEVCNKMPLIPFRV